MATYKPRTKKQYMIMSNVWELLLPAGAPPLRGPLYARYDLPVAMRPAVRALPPRPNAAPLLSAGINSLGQAGACTLGINIYARGMVVARLAARAFEPFAGAGINVVLRMEHPAQNQVKSLRVTGRLVAPAFSLGNIFSDVKTIPEAQRKKYLTQDEGHPVFDELRYLADYEKANPQAFRLRDEEVRFTPRQDGTHVARISRTDYPGVYRIAVHVEGAVVGKDGSSDPIFRILNTEVALGIKPDSDRTKPTLHWLAPERFVIRFTPADIHGNIAFPADLPTPRLLFHRQEVSAEYRNLYDGSHELEVTLKGKKLSPTTDGCHCESEANLSSITSQQIRIRPGELLVFHLRLGGTVLPVLMPTAVARGKDKPVGAGTPEAMQIPIEDRAVTSYLHGQEVAEPHHHGFKEPTKGSQKKKRPEASRKQRKGSRKR